MNGKEMLRVQFKVRRAAVQNRAGAEQTMLHRLLSHPAFLTSDQVFCFVSFGSEPDTHAFINRCLAMNKVVAVPRCETDGQMRFFRILTLSSLTPVPPYGILEPVTQRQEQHASAATLCIVPGLAFDNEGHRLGYGGGFYDRFLASFPGNSIGLCFADCMTQALPHTLADCRVEQIITEKQLHICKPTFA